jgi:hypothetical protein
MKISNKWYNILKYISMIALPAIVVFLSTIGDIWDFGWMPKVVGTISAVAVLLGALLQISTSNYWKEKANDEQGTS